MNLFHTYKTSYSTVSQPPGFADFVIGTMSLFTYSNKQVYADYTQHPISNFLINLIESPINLPNDTDKIVEFFNCSQTDITNFINEINQPIKLATNVRGYIINEELITFIKKTFSPKTDFQELINSKLNDLNLKNTNFTTIHIRLGDNFMHIDSNDHYCNVMQNIIEEKFTNENIFLIADNKHIKNFLSKKLPNIKIINNDPVHLGDLKQATLEKVRDTLLDFFIMGNSQKISCYSVYGGSGFSMLSSQIYNIPYTMQYI